MPQVLCTCGYSAWNTPPLANFQSFLGVRPALSLKKSPPQHFQIDIPIIYSHNTPYIFIAITINAVRFICVIIFLVYVSPIEMDALWGIRAETIASAASNSHIWLIKRPQYIYCWYWYKEMPITYQIFFFKKKQVDKLEAQYNPIFVGKKFYGEYTWLLILIISGVRL